MCIYLRFFCVFLIIFLCTFFAFFASADRRRRYIRYRDNIGYPRYGESYNIGDNQYSSTNLSYCPINRFLESVPFPTSVASGWGGAWGVWTGPGLVWMCSGVFAVELLLGGHLLAAGHLSFSEVCHCRGLCVGVRSLDGRGVGILRTGPVAAGVRVYSRVSHL